MRDLLMEMSWEIVRFSLIEHLAARLALGRAGWSSDCLFDDGPSGWHGAEDAQSPTWTVVIEQASTIATPRLSNSVARSSTLFVNQELPHQFALASSLQS